MDYIQTLSVLVRGSLQEKLQWIFKFYDVDDNGKLTKQTLENILRSLYDLLGANNCVYPPVYEDTIEKHLDIIFKKIDPRNLGSINAEDFIKFCLH
ncbi:unnamed protein product, partial [Didymodactylos carnosus]